MLQQKNLSQPVAMPMPLANSFIFRVFIVRDQEVGGSNPLAPTKFLIDLQKRTFESCLGCPGSPLCVPLLARFFRSVSTEIVELVKEAKRGHSFGIVENTAQFSGTRAATFSLVNHSTRPTALATTPVRSAT